VAEHDLGHVLDPDPGIGDRVLRDFHDQRFDVLGLVPAERRVAPADDACGHDGLLVAAGRGL
jgi:hypothetical protein